MRLPCRFRGVTRVNQGLCRTRRRPTRVRFGPAGRPAGSQGGVRRTVRRVRRTVRRFSPGGPGTGAVPPAAAPGTPAPPHPPRPGRPRARRRRPPGARAPRPCRVQRPGHGVEVAGGRPARPAEPCGQHPVGDRAEGRRADGLPGLPAEEHRRGRRAPLRPADRGLHADDERKLEEAERAAEQQHEQRRLPRLAGVGEEREGEQEQRRGADAEHRRVAEADPAVHVLAQGRRHRPAQRPH